MQVGDGNRHGNSGATTEGRRNVAHAASLVLATIRTVLPAKADFVSNAKTKLVNVFFEPPTCRLNAGAPRCGCQMVSNRLTNEKIRRIEFRTAERLA